MPASSVVHGLIASGRSVRVVCGDRRAEVASATWSQVSCAACLARQHGTRPPTAAEVLDRFAREKDFQQHVMDLGRQYGWLGFHAHDSRHSGSGFPDTTLVHEAHPDMIIIAELKMPGKHPTHDQQRWLTALGAATRHTVHVWYPEDLEAIAALLATPRRD